MTLNPNADTPETRLDEDARTRVEAAAFRAVVAHLRERTDVQNIDMMNLTGMCRNCLSRWYAEAAAREGVSLSKDEGRHVVYGEPYEDWQAKHQSEASPAQEATFERAINAHAPRGAARGAADAGGMPVGGSKTKSA